MTNNKQSLYIVMPAYNEEHTIEYVVKSWYKNLEYGNNDSRLVVADKGSTDNTHEILTKLAKHSCPKLRIINTESKLHGPKLISLYWYAIKHNADYVFQTDSDNQTNANEFEDFWKSIDKYDAILGLRKKRAGQHSRAFVEKVIRVLLKIYFKVDIRDANAPFRLMESRCLANHLKKIPKDYNLPNIMLACFFEAKSKTNFKEISFKSRATGKSSLNFAKIFIIGINALKDFKKFRHYFID